MLDNIFHRHALPRKIHRFMIIDTTKLTDSSGAAYC
jgi:hypothetical protein